MVPLLFLFLAAQIPGVPRSQPLPRPKAPPRPPTSIALVIKAGGREVRTTVLPRQPPPARRSTAQAVAGETPQVRWMVQNEGQKTPLRSVVVHFLIHRIEEPNQPLAEEPQKGSFADQVLGTDLKPRGKTTGNYNTPIYTPGVYLVELELLDPTGTRLQYAALDLTVTER